MIRHVKIPTSKDKLIGVLFSHEKSNKINVFLHGFGSYKCETSYLYSTIAKVQKENDSLLFDFYGCGDSPGLLQDMSYQSMKEDTVSVLEWVKQVYPTYDITLYAKGLSVPIAFEVSSLFSIRNIISITGNGSLNLPPAIRDEPIIQKWKLEKRIEVYDLINHMAEDHREILLDWFIRLGFLAHEFRADLIDYLLVEQLDELVVGKQLDNKKVLWFTYDSKEVSDYSNIKWVRWNRNEYNDTYLLPETIDRLIEFINKEHF